MSAFDEWFNGHAFHISQDILWVRKLASDAFAAGEAHGRKEERECCVALVRSLRRGAWRRRESWPIDTRDLADEVADALSTKPEEG